MRQNRDIPFGSTASIYSFNPSFAADLFFSSPFICPQKNHWSPQIPEARSTGSKQTLNGLFIFITRVVPKNILRTPGRFTKLIQRYFIPANRKFIDGLERTIGLFAPILGLDLNVHTRR
jgi:hypothetical protein